MASSSNEEENIEYDSDPEETKRSLSMRRRREASDDEVEDEDEDRVVIHSDESDSEGGAADYDDEEELEQDEEEEEEYYEVVEEEEEGSGANGAVVIMVKESDGDVKEPLDEAVKRNDNDEEKKKESEPFAVPTAGAFYMHDDRFRDAGGGGTRNRRMRGGRRLWESKDNRKWGHDKFEEITLQERHYKEGRRSSRGNYRGRGKTRGIGRGGYARDNTKGYDDRGIGRGGYARDNTKGYDDRGIGRGGYARDNTKGYDDRGSETQFPKGAVRGRGPRRYVPSSKSNGSTSQVQYKQSWKPLNKTSNVSLGRNLTPISNSGSDPVPAKKQVFGSNLNSASPPFYPSGSSNKGISQAPQRGVKTGSTSRNVHSGAMDEGFVVQQNNALLKGKNIVDAVSFDNSIRPSVGKPLKNMHMQLSGSSEVNVSQSTYPGAAGRGGAIPVQMNYQSASSLNQANKIPPTQLQAIRRTSAPGQALVQAPTPQLDPPKTSVTVSSLGSGEIDATSDSGKFKGTWVGKSQGSERGAFVYEGATGTAGNMGGNHGDQNFPAFLPVMQFGGQHPRGMGVPAVGMAFPGYAGQPQMGMGSSEMTWLPMLAGAAGALGATYGSPYLSVNGAYHAQQSGQTSAVATSSNENNASNTANNEWKLPQRPEPVSHEFGQRQNKPRRYSEMNFGE